MLKILANTNEILLI